MKWVSVNSSSTNERYELWTKDEKLASVSFSAKTHIVRFVSNLGMRLFFFEKRGLMNPKTVIANEYGIRIGKLESDKNSPQKGMVELDGKKYCFQVNPNNSDELSIYEEGRSQTIMNCSFNMVSNGITKAKSILDTKLPCLLMMLCWYALISHQSPYSGAAA